MVTPEILQEELHIDGEENVLQNLIDDGREYIMNAVNSKLPESYFEEYRAYDRGVKSYATAFYYDRTGGVNPKGLVMAVNVLRGHLAGVISDEDNASQS